jgi:hypothetical protein
MLMLMVAWLFITLGSSFMPMQPVVLPHLQLFMNDQKGRVSMYTKAACGYCTKALNILQDQYHLNVTLIELAQDSRFILLKRPFSGSLYSL